MAEYVVTIKNGTGSENLPAGLYNVAASVTGYDGALDTTTFTATSSAGAQAFTLAATGELTLNVNDMGGVGGNPITSGTFIRCSQDGLTEYGTAKSISTQGVCIFNNVPFGDGVTPYTFYVKQLTSDTTHAIHVGVIAIQMAASTQSEYVKNDPAAEQTFTFTDVNYSGLNLSGSLTFTGPQ